MDLDPKGRTLMQSTSARVVPSSHSLSMRGFPLMFQGESSGTLFDFDGHWQVKRKVFASISSNTMEGIKLHAF